MQLYQETAHSLSQKLRKKEIKAVEILDSVWQRIDQVESQVKSYLTLTREASYETARGVDQLIAQGKELPPLAGIPIALKDNLSTTGVRTTCASKILENYLPPYDATVVTAVKNEQLVMLGKTNLDEFAMGSSTENSAYGASCNPWNLATVPGGSSGGSAAAVAAGETILSLGSDTGGSIRQPAAYCGVVGLKPTYGRVSRYGLVAFASSLDQIGPITKDVTDAAYLLQAIAAYDPKDSTSVQQATPDYLAELTQGVKGLRIGLAKEYLSEGLDPAIRSAVDEAIKLYQKLGAEIVEVSLPHTEYALAAYYIIAPAEASSNLARYDGVRYGHRTAEEVSDSATLFMKTRQEGFGAEVKRRIMIGTYVLSAGYYDAYYHQAQRVRTLIRNDFENAFKNCDLILTPATPTVAFKAGSQIDDPLQMYLNDLYTVTSNLSGIPGISFPGGFKDGLPIGLQLLGPAFREDLLLRGAYSFEQATEFHKQRPRL